MSTTLCVACAVLAVLVVRQVTGLVREAAPVTPDVTPDAETPPPAGAEYPGSYLDEPAEPDDPGGRWPVW